MPDATPPPCQVPADIAQAIAIVNAQYNSGIPAVIACLTLASEIQHLNLQQQVAIALQQSVYQVVMAATAKSVSLIVGARDQAAVAAAVKEAIASLQQLKSAAQPLLAVAPPAELAPALSNQPAGSGAAGTELPTAIATGDLKSLAELPCMLANLAYGNAVANTNLSQQNAVAFQQAMNELAIAITGQSVNLLSTNPPATETRSAVDVLTDDDLAKTIADLAETKPPAAAAPA